MMVFFLPAIPVSRNAKLIAQKTQNLINNPIYLCADSRSVRRGGNSQNHGGNAEETAHGGPLDYCKALCGYGCLIFTPFNV
jgi:hypothetical protein